MKSFFFSFGLSMVGLVAASHAAAAVPPGTAWALLDSFSAGYSYTADAGLRGGGGEIGVNRFEFEAGGRTTLRSGAAITHGLGIVRTELQRSGAALLPERLEEISWRAGWTWQRDAQWRFMAMARPGFFGDGGSPDADTFNVPLIALASYGASRDLVWSFGVIANAFGDNPVLPVAGVRWAFAPEWTLNLAFPRAGLVWEANPTLTLTAGATVQGGAYRLTRSPNGSVGGRALIGEKVDYREVRLGVGGTFKVSEGVLLTLDVGSAVDQRFDYHERGLEYRGEDAVFVSLALSGRF